MCCKDNSQECCCEKPDRLKERPQACTPEQIRECHGEVQEHTCASEGKSSSGKSR
jgi:hypothetical protein